MMSDYSRHATGTETEQVMPACTALSFTLYCHGLYTFVIVPYHEWKIFTGTKVRGVAI